jgi:hypothetical protein
MNISTIPQTGPFRYGLIKYRVLSTGLTFLFGMLTLLGCPEFVYASAFAAQKALFLSIMTGALGAAITSYQLVHFIHRMDNVYVMDRLEMSRNFWSLWRKHFSEWNTFPLLTIAIAFVMMIVGRGEIGTIWFFLYISASPIWAGLFRLVILVALGSPAKRRMI